MNHALQADKLKWRDQYVIRECSIWETLQFWFNHLQLGVKHIRLPKRYFGVVSFSSHLSVGTSRARDAQHTKRSSEGLLRAYPHPPVDTPT